MTPWTVASQAPLSTGFSRQEYWTGLPCLPPGDLPGSGIKPASPALQGHALPLSHQGSPLGAPNYILSWSQENEGPSGSEEKGSPEPTRHQIHHLEKPVKHKHFGEPVGNNRHRPISFSFILFIYLLASGPITSWQIDMETVETVTDYFWGLQNHCRWWLQPRN